MKKIERYVCEVCGTEYKYEDVCSLCEEGHHKPLEISGAHWASMKENGSGYPTQIYAWYSFIKRNYHHLFPTLCSRSRFNRTRRALLQTTELLRQKLSCVFPIPASRYFVVDSFPLAVCKFGRARYCRSFRGYGADYGKCPSKKETYFGYKEIGRASCRERV